MDPPLMNQKCSKNEAVLKAPDDKICSGWKLLGFEQVALVSRQKKLFGGS